MNKFSRHLTFGLIIWAFASPMQAQTARSPHTQMSAGKIVDPATIWPPHPSAGITSDDVQWAYATVADCMRFGVGSQIWKGTTEQFERAFARCRALDANGDGKTNLDDRPKPAIAVTAPVLPPSNQTHSMARTPSGTSSIANGQERQPAVNCPARTAASDAAQTVDALLNSQFPNQKRGNLGRSTSTVYSKSWSSDGTSGTYRSSELREGSTVTRRETSQTGCPKD